LASSSNNGTLEPSFLSLVSAPLYLPPYSPDFNPIEQLFATLKALLGKAAEPTVGGLWKRIGKLPDAFQPSECANYVQKRGLRSHNEWKPL
jgi:transposase